jgi:hypothetical protein
MFKQTVCDEGCDVPHVAGVTHVPPVVSQLPLLQIHAVRHSGRTESPYVHWNWSGTPAQDALPFGWFGGHGLVVTLPPVPLVVVLAPVPVVLAPVPVVPAPVPVVLAPVPVVPAPVPVVPAPVPVPPVPLEKTEPPQAVRTKSEASPK